MKNILERLKWYFFGVRCFVPFVPRFVWSAFEKIYTSTIDYWKNSQSVVNKLSTTFKDEVMEKMSSDYSLSVYWACYALASFLYLLGWLAMSWLTMEVFRMLISLIF